VVQQIEIIERPWRSSSIAVKLAGVRIAGRMLRFPADGGRGKAGLAGPSLTALVAYLKGVGHASFSTIRKFFRDVLKARISRGQLAKLMGKVTARWPGCMKKSSLVCPANRGLNVDETGHKENGAPLWTWCFRAELYTLFRIDPSEAQAC